MVKEELVELDVDGIVLCICEDRGLKFGDCGLCMCLRFEEVNFQFYVSGWLIGGLLLTLPLMLVFGMKRRR